MDLYAFAQIDLLEKIAKENGIEVPRLRGYRLMALEKPIPEDYYKQVDPFFLETLVCSKPIFNPNGVTEFSYETGLKRDYYLIKKDDIYVDFNWNRLSGKNRKIVKTAIRNQLSAQKKQAETYNKYVGRNDVLYIHSRIGGNNWNYYDGVSLVCKDWFIEVCDDAYDGTYCDIYARIKPLSPEEIEQIKTSLEK